MQLLRNLGLTTIILLAGQASAAYVLEDTFDTSNFFAEFDFQATPDPTHGFVNYIDGMTANETGIAGYSDNGKQVFLGVDYKEKNPQGGRKSVRVESKKQYTQGLFIADIATMPKQACGAWPAFWTANTADWPASGEIDIIEGVNLQKTNSMTLHTADGCSMERPNLPGVKMAHTNCNENTGYTGCGQEVENDTKNYGGDFNSLGGGVYALDWNSESIDIYFFGRNAIPADIKEGKPDPKTWAKPTVTFKGNCNIDNHFKKHKIIINTTFCGDWAGRTWSDGECAALAPNCEQYVAEHPEVFEHTFWAFNSIKVFRQTGTAPMKRGLTAKPFNA